MTQAEVIGEKAVLKSGTIHVRTDGQDFLVALPGENTVEPEHFSLANFDPTSSREIPMSNGRILYVAVTDHTEGGTPRVAVQVDWPNMYTWVWNDKLVEGDVRKPFEAFEIINQG